MPPHMQASIPVFNSLFTFIALLSIVTIVTTIY